MIKFSLLIFLVLFFSCENKIETTALKVTQNQHDRNETTDQIYELPKCETLCPEDYKILKGKQNDRDYLAFANFGYRGIGRCRGHAIVSQKVTELSEFNPNSKLNCNTKTLSPECEIIIQGKLNGLMNYQVETFPGFKNVYEFSRNLAIQGLLKSYVRGISHKYSAGRGHVRDDHYDSLKESVFNEVISRVKENQRPYIGIKGAAVGHHAVIAHEESFIDGKTVICVHDSNIIFHEQADSCLNYLYMQDEQVFYKRYQKEETVLYIFSLTNDEDKRVAKYIEARYNYCIENNRNNNLCK